MVRHCVLCISCLDFDTLMCRSWIPAIHFRVGQAAAGHHARHPSGLSPLLHTGMRLPSHASTLCMCLPTSYGLLCCMVQTLGLVHTSPIRQLSSELCIHDTHPTLQLVGTAYKVTACWQCYSRALSEQPSCILSHIVYSVWWRPN